jgi:hypothetical protein
MNLLVDYNNTDINNYLGTQLKCFLQILPYHKYDITRHYSVTTASIHVCSTHVNGFHLNFKVIVNNVLRGRK